VVLYGFLSGFIWVSSWIMRFLRGLMLVHPWFYAVFLYSFIIINS
jgi:hypothetical protein